MFRIKPLLSIILTLTCFFVFHSSAQAAPEDFDFKVCSDIFRYGNSDSIVSSSESEHYEVIDNKLRNTNFETYEQFKSSSGSLGINLPLAEGILGLSGSDEQKQREFKQKYLEYSQQSYSQRMDKIKQKLSVSQINKSVYDSYNHCITNHRQALLEKYGLVLKGSLVQSIQDNKPFFSKFVINAEQRSPILEPIKITSIQPSGSVKCFYANTEIRTFPFTLPDKTSTFGLTCQPLTNQEFEFSIHTSQGYHSNIYKVPFQTAAAYELENRAKQAEAENKLLKDELIAIKSDFSSIKSQKIPAIDQDLINLRSILPKVESQEIIIAGSTHPDGDGSKKAGRRGAPPNQYTIGMPGITKGIKQVWFIPIDNTQDLAAFNHINVVPAGGNAYTLSLGASFDRDALVRLKVFALDGQ